jgi:hypothetical protein
MMFKSNSPNLAPSIPWFLAWLPSVAGYTLTGLMFHFPSGFPPNNDARFDLPALFVGAIMGALTGLLIGVFQGVILRRYFVGVSGWIGANVAAMAAIHAVGDALPDRIALPVVQVLGALLLGVACWLAVRRNGARRGPWILATAAAWFVGLTMGLALYRQGGSDWQTGHIIVALATGVVVSITTSVLFLSSLRARQAVATSS